MASSTSTPQAPIGSGFGAKTTAAEVLEGVGLTGRLALVTGGYSGLGLEITRALTGAGAEVLVPARRPEVATETLAAEGIEAEVGTLDLGDLTSVRTYAQAFRDSGRELDLVIDNAGIMATPLTRVGHGWEAQFATNHLGHFALVGELWSAIRKGGDSRVVSVSSAGHLRSGIRFDDLMWETGEYDKWAAYGQSKTANVLFAVELDRLGREHGVRAFALHPGGIMTPLQRHLPQEEMIAMGWLEADGSEKPGLFKTTEQGAATATWAATSPQLAGLGGVYLEDVEVAEPYREEAGRRGVAPWAIDPDAAARLWDVSVELTGVDGVPR